MPAALLFSKSNILKFIRPIPNSVLNCENHRTTKLVTSMRVGRSYLLKHKFKNSFQDTLNLICSCVSDVKSTSHYVFHCLLYNDKRRTLLSITKTL